MTFSLISTTIILAFVAYNVAYSISAHFFGTPTERKRNEVLNNELNLIHSRWIASERALNVAQSELARTAHLRTQ